MGEAEREANSWRQRDLRGAPRSAFGLAVAAAALSTLLRLPLQPWVGGTNSFTLYYPAIVLVAWFAGFWPGLVTTALAAVAAQYLFIIPYYGQALAPRDILLNQALFLLVSLGLNAITDAWRRAEIARRVASERQLAQEMELRRSEQGARESEERFRIAADSAPVLIWTAGTDGRFDWLSKPWLDFTGRTPADEPAGSWAATLHPDDRASSLERYAEAFATRQPLRLEHRLRRADGAYRWVEERAVPRFTPDHTFSGFLGSSIDITDRKSNEEELQRLVREQRRDREELQIMARIGRIMAAELDLERLSQALADEATAALGAAYGELYTFGASGWRPATVGPGSGSGTTPARAPAGTGGGGSAPGQRGELRLQAVSGLDQPTALTATGETAGSLPRGVLPLAPPPDPTQLMRSDDLGADERFTPEERQQVAVGTIAGGPIELRSYLAAPVMSAAGQLRGGLVFGHPEAGCFGERAERILRGVAVQAGVSLDNAFLYREAHASRQVAEDANRSKDEFLATVSHELRTPLNAMMGWAQLLQMSRGDEAKLTTGLEIIVRNAKLQAQLIDDLLDMSRIVSGKMRLDVRSVDLVKVIDNAVDAARPAAEAKSIRVLRMLDPLAGPVAGDADRLQQVVWNLLSNAVKFTNKGGKIEIRLERVNSHLEIMISDTGAGISPDLLPHVFERFRQSDSSTTRARGGLGLGLAIVRHLVELHGGTVHAKSPGEDQGSTFIVMLPLSIAHLGDDRVHPRAKPDDGGTPAVGATDLASVRVLVVDDEADSRDTLRQVLEHCHAEVLTAGSAAEALAKVADFRPHVLLSDIGMPVEDGYSLIRQLRALPPEQGGRIPAAALTAFARTEDRRRALVAGFEMHLSKPVEIHELCAVVATLARRFGTLGEVQGGESKEVDR